ncbi:MAG: hypothetical protein HUU55_01650 [Myxococcales bacterium]|nr:hypothetical protein [Myxococcales bacterium]
MSKNYVGYLCDEDHCMDPDDCAISVAIEVINSTQYDVVLTFEPTEVFVAHDFEVPSSEEDAEDLVLPLLTTHFRSVDSQGRSTVVVFCNDEGNNPQALVLRDSQSEIDVVYWDEDMEINHEPAPDLRFFHGASLPDYPHLGSAIVSWWAKAKIEVRLFGSGTPPSSGYVKVNKPGLAFRMYPKDLVDPPEFESLVPPGMAYNSSRFDRDVTVSKPRPTT